MEKLYNYLGQELSDAKILLISPEYGYVDEENVPHINWGEEDSLCDKDGFDKEFRPIEGMEVHLIENYIIPKGTILCRYGFSGGFFTTLKGSTYETLGLPYVKETIEYHEYKVSEDVCVNCYVTKGKVAPKFTSIGGAVQFMHKQTIALECGGWIFTGGYVMATKNYLEALEIVVSKRYPRKMYNIGGYQEAAICLQSEINGWTVYNGERGNRYAEIKCDTILKACLEFIRKFTHRAEDIASMENELITILGSKVA